MSDTNEIMDFISASLRTALDEIYQRLIDCTFGMENPELGGSVPPKEDETVLCDGDMERCLVTTWLVSQDWRNRRITDQGRCVFQCAPSLLHSLSSYRRDHAMGRALRTLQTHRVQLHRQRRRKRTKLRYRRQKPAKISRRGQGLAGA